VADFLREALYLKEL